MQRFDEINEEYPLSISPSSRNNFTEGFTPVVVSQGHTQSSSKVRPHLVSRRGLDTVLGNEGLNWDQLLWLMGKSCLPDHFCRGLEDTVVLAGSHFSFDWLKNRFTPTTAARTGRADCPRGSLQDYCVMMQLCNPLRHRIAVCGGLQ